MPVAVELNGLLPGRGPGRGAPGRGPGAPGRGAAGRGAPGPWVRGGDGRAPWPPWDGWSERPGRCPPEPGAPGRGAEGRAVPVPGPVPGPRKSAGVTGGRGALGAPDPPGVPCGHGSAGTGPGRDMGDGGTGGSRRAAGSAAPGPPEVPLAAAPSGAAARSALPLAARSGAALGTGGALGAAPAATAAGRSSRASRDAVPTPDSGRGPGPGRTPAGEPAWAATAPSRGADEADGLGLDCSAALAENASLSRRTTGASIVEEADLTNSPISLSWSMTTLLSTPNSFASS